MKMGGVILVSLVAHLVFTLSLISALFIAIKVISELNWHIIQPNQLLVPLKLVNSAVIQYPDWYLGFTNFKTTNLATSLVKFLFSPGYWNLILRLLTMVGLSVLNKEVYIGDQLGNFQTVDFLLAHVEERVAEVERLG